MFYYTKVKFSLLLYGTVTRFSLQGENTHWTIFRLYFTVTNLVLMYIELISWKFWRV